MINKNLILKKIKSKNQKMKNNNNKKMINEKNK